jgi:hypothetical protein
LVTVLDELKIGHPHLLHILLNVLIEMREKKTGEKNDKDITNSEQRGQLFIFLSIPRAWRESRGRAFCLL